MDQFKLKHMTRLQRMKWDLKQLNKKKRKGIVTRLKIRWLKRGIETIRINQFTRGDK